MEVIGEGSLPEARMDMEKGMIIQTIAEKIVVDTQVREDRRL